jgi:hypothetical protein
MKSGGRGGARTPGLIVANDALSQLSYTPTARFILTNERRVAKHVGQQVSASGNQQTMKVICER